MTRNLDHIVAISGLANERRAQGKPVWDHRIKIDLTSLETFEARRDAWANALEKSAWFKEQTTEDEYGDLWQVWDEMKDSEEEEHFNYCLDSLYDMADVDRVWITVDPE